MTLLRDLRRSRALTFLDLASLSGLPARLLAEAEYGLRSLNPQECARLATVFGLADATLLAQPAALPGQRPPAASPFPVPNATYRALVVAALAGTLAISTLRPLALPQFNLSAALPPRAAVQTVATAESLAVPQRLLPTLTPPPSPTAIALRQETAREELALIPTTEAFRIPNPTATPTIAATVPAVAPAVPTAASAFPLTAAGPLGCPVQTAAGRVVITQGYGVGTHAPADIWGAVDLAVDSNGDGWAEPDATRNALVVATIGGTVQVNLDSWPGGNHVWIEDAGSGWATGYAHLAVVFVGSGQQVTPGTILGMVGSTGMSSGPHLDYQVWHGGVNIDPTNLVSGCE